MCADLAVGSAQSALGPDPAHTGLAHPVTVKARELETGLYLFNKNKITSCIEIRHASDAAVLRSASSSVAAQIGSDGVPSSLRTMEGVSGRVGACRLQRRSSQVRFRPFPAMSCSEV